MSKRQWVYDPHSGGKKIPEAAHSRIRKRIEDFAATHYAGKYTRLEIRFKGKFCYIDAYTEPDVRDNWPPEDWPETREEYYERLRNTPVHLCRLRFFGDEDAWSMAFYTYSNESYTPSMFNTGSFTGTPEEAFDTSAVYLQG